jgi:hypothetical protein
MKRATLKKAFWAVILLFGASARGQDVNGTATAGSQSISGVDASVHADVTERAKQPTDFALKPSKQLTNPHQGGTKSSGPSPTIRFWPDQQTASLNSPSFRAGSEKSDANPDARLLTEDRSVFRDSNAPSPDGFPRKGEFAGTISPQARTGNFSALFPNKPVGLAGAGPFTSAISKATAPRKKIKEHRQKLQPQPLAHSGHQTSPFDLHPTTKQ